MEGMENFIHHEYIEQELKDSEVYRYLDKYMDTETPLDDVPVKKDCVKLNCTIWVLWMQGMKNAPHLVRKCYESVCENKPGEYDAVLLSELNLGDYITLPDCIWEKYENGCISTTHLSDIIRVELLAAYGGCWIDATVFCSGKIPWYMLSKNMFLFKIASVGSDPVEKMSSWWISAGKSNRIVLLTRRMLYAYWQNETDIRNYFLLHIIMSKIIDTDLESQIVFGDIPYFNSGNAHVLYGKLGKAYDEEEYGMIKDASVIHKLSYKRKYLQGDIYNYYMALLEGNL